MPGVSVLEGHVLHRGLCYLAPRMYPLHDDIVQSIAETFQITLFTLLKKHVQSHPFELAISSTSIRICSVQ